MLVVTPSSAIDFIDDCLDAGQVPCLIGDPGAGKSDAFRATARRRGSQYRALPIGLYAVEDLVGVPSIVGGRTVFNPPNLGIFADDPISGELLIHLEELPHAPIAVQGALYECLLDGSINGKPIHTKVRFCASGNPLTSRGASNHLSTALRSRMVMARFVNDAKSWMKEAATRGVPPIMIAYIAMMAERGQEAALNGFDPKVDGNSPNPRGWMKAAQLWDVMEAKGRDLDKRLVTLAGAIGEGRAVEFIGFCRIVNDLPYLGDVHKDPLKAPLPPNTEPSVTYSVVTWLAFNATKEKMEPFVTYARRLGDEFCAAFVSMATNRDPSLTESPGYIQWASASRSRVV